MSRISLAATLSDVEPNTETSPWRRFLRFGKFKVFQMTGGSVRTLLVCFSCAVRLFSRVERESLPRFHHQVRAARRRRQPSARSLIFPAKNTEDRVSCLSDTQNVLLLSSKRNAAVCVYTNNSRTGNIVVFTGGNVMSC